jgi:DNA primase
VQIKNTEQLSSYIRSKDISGDIYTVVGYIVYDYDTFDDIRDNIGQIKDWICQTLGYYEYLGFGWQDSKPKDWNAWLRPIKKARVKPEDYVQHNEILDEAILKQFIPMPHMLWLKDGIELATQRYFGVGFDIDSERIIYPIHNKDGQLIGVKGRYVGKDPEQLDDYKYMPLHAYSKSIELYNLHRAMKHIKDRGEVIVVESAKSCMLLWQWGYPNCVSLEGKSISPCQVRMLKDMKAVIIFALDYDVTDEELGRTTSGMKNRVVYAIPRPKNIAIYKQSPLDFGYDVWHNVYVDKRKLF